MGLGLHLLWLVSSANGGVRVMMEVLVGGGGSDMVSGSSGKNVGGKGDGQRCVLPILLIQKGWGWAGNGLGLCFWIGSGVDQVMCWIGLDLVWV